MVAFDGRWLEGEPLVYLDKTTGKEIVMSPISGSFFLHLRRHDEGEAVFRLLAKSETVQPDRWIPQDGLIRFQLRKGVERHRAWIKELESMRTDHRVSGVLPLFRDKEGFERAIVPRELVVLLHKPATENLEKAFMRLGLSVSRKLEGERLLIVESPLGADYREIIQALSAFEGVQVVEPSYYGIDDAEMAPRFAYEESSGHTGASVPWNLALVKADQAWRRVQGDRNVVIAVVDGSPQENHPALMGKIISEQHPSNVFTQELLLSSHGTAVSGLIAGSIDSDSRVIPLGMAPGSRVLPVVISLTNQRYAERASALLWLADLAAARPFFEHIVVNCSWKTAGDVAVIRAALKSLLDTGALIVTSAGNENTAAPHYPSDYANIWPGLLSVAAVGPTDRRAPYSSYSPYVTLCAPGGYGPPLDQDDLYVPDLGSSFTYDAGTSLAAPHVAAAAALVWSVAPELSSAEVRSILERSADPVDNLNPDTAGMLGAGRLNVGCAVEMAAEGIAPVEPAPEPIEPIWEPEPIEPKEPEFTLNWEGVLLTEARKVSGFTEAGNDGALHAELAGPRGKVVLDF